MSQPATDTPRIPAQQMAVRVAMISTAAFVLFGIVFFRLWYLQVLDGGKYLAEARENRSRTERIQAPRGKIVDANGRIIVDNRAATVVALDPRRIPAGFREEVAGWGQAYGTWNRRATRAVGKVSKRRGGIEGWRKRAIAKIGKPPPMPRATGEQWRLYERLGRVLERRPERINRAVVASLVQVPYANVTVAKDIGRAERQTIAERHERYPGVSIEQVYTRSYPQRNAAAQMLGVIGEIAPEDIGKPHYKGVGQGTIVGRSGLEYQYDRFLRGSDGTYQIEVNAFGERRNAKPAQEPKAGSDLRLTVDLGLQRAAQEIVGAYGKPGAFVAMNPRTGAIYALGSLPDYNPRELMGPFETPAEYREKFGEAAGKPIFNRAISGVYPTGSTFKPVTALAALDAKVITPQETYNDTGCIDTGTRAVDRACNAKSTPHGAVDLRRAMEVSSDTYFYNTALRMFGRGSWALQEWAGKLGFGRDPGLDLPSVATGSVPSPKTYRDITRRELACRKRTKKPSCGIGSGDPQFRGGDLVNLSVGQGGLQASPVQLALAYSTIINGGDVPTPHVGAQIEDERGVIQTMEPGARRHVAIDGSARTAIMDGLRRAANGPEGTSTGVFAASDPQWPNTRVPVLGKTGTAETSDGQGGLVDQSWYVGYAHRASDPKKDPIVVVVTVERGGFGADAAAPAACKIMARHFKIKAGCSGSVVDE